MSDNILSAICRAMIARDTDTACGTLSGVCINTIAGDLVRCEATNGKMLAVCHAHKAGIELNAPAVIHSIHLPRLVQFYKRNKRAMDDIAIRRNPAKADRPMIIVRQIDGEAPGAKVLEFVIPALDDVCRVKLQTGITYPNVRGQEVRGKAWKLGIGGAHFNLSYLSLIPKILPGGHLPYTTGPSRTIWKSTTSGDYVLVMPMTVPDSDAVELFPELSP